MGIITNKLYWLLKKQGQEVDILPALGTHDPMTAEELISMFGSEIPEKDFLVHNWRSDTIEIGKIPSQLLAELSDGNLEEEISLQINQNIFKNKYDLIISLGQVLPHEVVGMANYTKNIVVGCGGSQIINYSHFLGALAGMENIMGKDHSAVRKLYDYCQEEFLDSLPLLYLMTVNSSQADKESGLTEIKGIFCGKSRDSFEKAVALSQKENIIKVEKPLQKVVVYLKADKFKSTWLGCKAVYRSRKAIADGGELIIIAPGINKFGEDKAIDKLIRKYGYLGSEKIIEAVKNNQDLRENLSAAAHLIHGSSEGRFKIYLAAKNLIKKEIETVNFNYLAYNKAVQKYKIEDLEAGFNQLGSEEVFYINNPATALWVYR